MLSKYREKIYECGDYTEVNIYPVFAPPGPRRKKRFRPTRETQERLNQKNAENKLARILNANFTEEDVKFELTYSPEHHPTSEEEAAKELRNFLRRMKRLRKKKGLPDLKYITATERGQKKGRYHHHVVASGGLLPKEIAELWGRGYVQKIQPLQFDECGIMGIAKYFPKDQKRNGERLFYKRWNESKNLIHPEAQIRESILPGRTIEKLAKDTENRRLYEAVFKGFYLGQAEVVYNDVNGGIYLIVRLYKRGARFLCKSKQRNQKNRPAYLDGRNLSNEDFQSWH